MAHEREPARPPPPAGGASPRAEGHDDSTERTTDKKRRPRGERERSAHHSEYAGSGEGYRHGAPEAGSVWERLCAVSRMAPVHGDPTLDPAGDAVAVSEMCGYNAGAAGFSVLDGPDRLATGEADAGRFLRVEGSTPGPPLRLGPRELAGYLDVDGRGTHDTGLGARRADWTRELGLDNEEGVL